MAMADTEAWRTRIGESAGGGEPGAGEERMPAQRRATAEPARGSGGAGAARRGGAGGCEFPEAGRRELPAGEGGGGEGGVRRQAAWGAWRAAAALAALAGWGGVPGRRPAAPDADAGVVGARHGVAPVRGDAHPARGARVAHQAAERLLRRQVPQPELPVGGAGEELGDGARGAGEAEEAVGVAVEGRDEGLGEDLGVRGWEGDELD